MRPASAPSLKPNRHKNMHHKKSSSNRQKNRSTSRYGNAYTSFTNSMLAQRKFNELQSEICNYEFTSNVAIWNFGSTNKCLTKF